MSSTGETESGIFGGKTAAILGGIFLFFFVMMAVLGAMDRSQRAHLETVNSRSAVGDPITFIPQPSADASTPVMVKDGIPLFIVKYEGAHDDDLRKAGTDDTGKILLYHRVAKGGGSGFKNGYRVRVVQGLCAVLREQQK